jgi:hypothetical protein
LKNLLLSRSYVHGTNFHRKKIIGSCLASPSVLPVSSYINMGFHGEHVCHLVSQLRRRFRALFSFPSKQDETATLMVSDIMYFFSLVIQYYFKYLPEDSKT